ncbi:uncharacterized protein LOC131893145 [Tigriopus californicus]|uniref:uncharacterized protein LOC131893145 n=1 Tax=Tigriopus californicus TaxID=6832 RepID=UPI0027DA0A57|nr:uncharacterized protein LOC131893145 [Tigriopus californicus]
MPEDIKEPPKASLSSWFRRKKSIPSVNENLLNDGTEIIETGQQWSRTPPSPVSQIIVRSSEIPVQLVNTQEINPNLDLSLDEELEPTMENNLHTNLESIPEEGPQDVLDGEQRNAPPNLDPPEVFFDKFMDKWDKDREQRGCQPETYIYGLEQHQSVMAALGRPPKYLFGWNDHHHPLEMYTLSARTSFISVL